MNLQVPGLALLLLLGTALGTATPAAAIEHRLGLGIHEWKPASELLKEPQDGDESDLTVLVSYQLVLFRPLKLQVDLEFFPNGFGGSGEEAWFPQGSIVVGDRFYAALGAGSVYSEALEGSLSDVIYSARLGIDIPILPRLRLDVSADHRAPDLSGLGEVEAETVTFAAVVRVRL